MGLGGQPDKPAAPVIVPLPVPDNAVPGTMDFFGDTVPTKQWQDDRGHAVHVGGVDVADTHIHGVTGHSKDSPKKAEDHVRRTIERIVERMPVADEPFVDVAKPAQVTA